LVEFVETSSKTTMLCWFRQAQPVEVKPESIFQTPPLVELVETSGGVLYMYFNLNFGISGKMVIS
jgi:hypothetical protein